MRPVCTLLLTMQKQFMADEFTFLWPQIQNYIAEADADLTPVPRH